VKPFHSRSFSIDRYGFDRAHALAVKARGESVAQAEGYVGVTQIPQRCRPAEQRRYVAALGQHVDAVAHEHRARSPFKHELLTPSPSRRFSSTRFSGAMQRRAFEHCRLGIG